MHLVLTYHVRTVLVALGFASRQPRSKTPGSPWYELAASKLGSHVGGVSSQAARDLRLTGPGSSFPVRSMCSLWLIGLDIGELVASRAGA